ncbi:DUF5361 domain-containing protein [Rothia koreensis]|uniref:DUF5361 domain-containing protein n=1 Tax=Rothia koreensis TaxID=592378 RepID=UPI003FCC4BED
MHRCLDPEGWDWDAGTHLLACLVDSVRWLQWSKTEDAQQGMNVPQLLPRPHDQDQAGSQQDGMDLDAAMQWLVQKNGPR